MGSGATERSLDFRRSALRLLRELAPYRVRVVVILVLGVSSVALSVLGPLLLGDATNVIFAGVIGRKVPAGVSQSAVVAHLRQSGQGTLANLVQSTPITHGIDFDHLGRILLQVLLVYLAASVASYFQGRLTAMVGQRSVARLRWKVQSKLTRLPLSYFDRQPRGEILSRVTNDIDNISQTLQQTLSQMVTSLLTIVGVLVAMFVISWLLALIALFSLYLRTRFINGQFWMDEGIAVGIASHSLSSIPHILRADGSPPLYYLLQVVPFKLVGAVGSGKVLDRLAVMRLLSVLMGAITVLLVFCFLRELLPRRPFVWSAGALLVATGYGAAEGHLAAHLSGPNFEVRFGRTIADFQGIQWEIARCAVDIEAARLLTYRAAWMADRGRFTKEWVPYLSMAKYHATEMAVRASSLAVQLLGAAGYMEDHPTEQWYRDAKQLTIVEGTSQVQLGLIGRGVLAGDLWWD